MKSNTCFRGYAAKQYGRTIMRQYTLKSKVLAAAAIPLSYVFVDVSTSVVQAAETRVLFVSSAVENPANSTVSLPACRGTSRGRVVWFVVLDASTSAAASQFGLNQSQKLQNARGTVAVQKVQVINGTIDFPASVDFSPQRVVVPGPAGFPPSAAQPGAVGEPGYSPLIEMPDGTILNAPQLANASGQADKIVTLDTVRGRVVYRETEGFANGSKVFYMSTDSSNPVAATLENVTFAPQLDFVPFVGNDETDSARASLAAFVNGQTGATNPQRQGLNSALLDGLDPRNILRWTPNQGRYSPMWDVHLAKWNDIVAASGGNVLQTDFGNVQGLADKLVITAPDGRPFQASGFVVNCPIISQVSQ